MTFHDHRTPLPAAVPPGARGLPGPTKRALMRTFIADRIEAYIALMDRLDGDPDLEDGGDAEPSLCGLEVTGSGAAGYADDREADAGDEPEEENEHGGDIQDEPHDLEEDCDPDAIVDHCYPRRRLDLDTRKNELIADARIGLDRMRRRKVASPAGNLRVVALPLGWR